jgi:hypothetical protein
MAIEETQEPPQAATGLLATDTGLVLQQPEQFHRAGTGLRNGAGSTGQRFGSSR